jgi:hypothetical protein
VTTFAVTATEQTYSAGSYLDNIIVYADRFLELGGLGRLTFSGTNTVFCPECNGSACCAVERRTSRVRSGSGPMDCEEFGDVDPLFSR